MDIETLSLGNIFQLCKYEVSTLLTVGLPTEWISSTLYTYSVRSLTLNKDMSHIHTIQKRNTTPVSLGLIAIKLPCVIRYLQEAQQLQKGHVMLHVTEILLSYSRSCKITPLIRTYVSCY